MVNVGTYTIHVSYGVDTVIVHPSAVNGVRKKKRMRREFNEFIQYIFRTSLYLYIYTPWN